MVELLAPAGSMESLVAAVESGANAIYLAGNAFGARAYANNFDEAALKEAIRFAHLRDVLINVTVNTIVADEEIPALKKYLRFLYEAGADALLVQDLGVAKLAREIVPTLPLHASTQMTVHNLAGVKALEKLGFTRVVLSRELSLAEIKYICQNATAEIEVFMHGALCVCYSGQCLMSSLIGGRSGNRGRCAQPCRLPYTLIDENGNDALTGKAGQYLLSPRDINTIEVLPQLIDAGVASLKIEGRMKRPEYVATVVSTYRQAIDSYYAGKYSVPAQAHDNLTQIFNRDFTTAYLLGRPGKELMSDRRPNNRGLLIGRVQAYDWDKLLVTVKLTGQLNIGDQVDFWVKVGGRVTATVQEMLNEQGQTITNAVAGQTVTFAIPATVHPHDRLFKIYDAKLMEEAKAKYNSGAPVRRLLIDVKVSVTSGQPLKLTINDKVGHSVQATTSFVAEIARKRPLTAEVVCKQLARLGTSVYEIDKFDCEINGEVMVPMSEINEVRRVAVEKLDNLRLAAYPLRLPVVPQVASNFSNKTLPASKVMVAVDKLSKMQAAIAAGADGILYGGESYEHRAITVDEYIKAAQIAKCAKVRFDVNLPRIIKENYQAAIVKLLQACEQTIKPAAVHVHNIGAWQMVAKNTTLPIHVDYSLISYNSTAVQAMQELGAAEVTLSPELNMKQLQELATNSKLPLTCIVHGRLELMVSEYCVLGTFIGDNVNGCSAPCQNQHYVLRDRKAAEFPVVTDQFCHMHILNSKVLSMLPHVGKLRKMGITTLRIEAKALTETEIAKVVADYVAMLKQPANLTKEQEQQIMQREGKNITRGHYFRGVQ